MNFLNRSLCSLVWGGALVIAIATAPSAVYAVCVGSVPNGVLQADEDCDDNNASNTDFCTNRCEIATCGDTFVCTGPSCLLVGESGLSETCDDGNLVDLGDACRNSCTRCGDGVLNGGVGEACDDGNQVNTDDCKNACSLNTCGDSVLKTTGTVPLQLCDDGNIVETDDCRSGCLLNICGDSVLKTTGTAPLQLCDDGNLVNTDACTNGCTEPRCGDMIVSPPESCDDGNVNNTDGCDNLCWAIRCGNGIVEGTMGEECDNGEDRCGADSFNANAACGDADDCLGKCPVGSPNSGIRCTVASQLAVCGAGHTCIGGGECIETAGNRDDLADHCRSDCRNHGCGDGSLDTDELCDDANTSNTDTCLNTCRIAACLDGFTCSNLSCVSGPASGPEVCDDGNSVVGDGCDASCAIERCGNGVIDSGESCDGTGTGNVAGIGGETATCDINCTPRVCGDGIINATAGETCDDSNLLALDGCDGTCRREFCGDGSVNNSGTEECDDLANNDTVANACRTNCKRAGCGDGVIDGVDAVGGIPIAEECDAGGESATCDNDCTVASCGDSTLNTTNREQCDAGTAPLSSPGGTGDLPDVCRISCRLPAHSDGIVDPILGERCDSGTVDTTACTADSCLTGTAPDSYDAGLHGAACQLLALEEDCAYDMCTFRGKPTSIKIASWLNKIAGKLDRIPPLLISEKLSAASKTAVSASRVTQVLSTKMAKFCPSSAEVRNCVIGDLGRLAGIFNKLATNLRDNKP